MNLAILDETLAEQYRLEFAQNGVDAIEIAKTLKPAAILLDVMMPEMDGLEVCRRIRQIAELNDTTIIMASAKALPAERAAGVEAGADFYITKPFDDAELLELLHRTDSRNSPRKILNDV
jgi:CheY-like chemotaxis protein